MSMVYNGSQMRKIRLQLLKFNVELRLERGSTTRQRVRKPKKQNSCGQQKPETRACKALKEMADETID
jgi:hypothetical protein